MSISPIGYRVKTVEEITGLGRTKVFALIKDGTLESKKVGGSRIVLARSVERLLGAEEAA